MSIKTVATIITESTYPVAVAAIPHLASRGAADCDGLVLVLNEIVVERVPVIGRRRYNLEESVASERRDVVTIRNIILTKKEFKQLYNVINTTDDPPKLSKMFFYEVERKLFKE